LWATNKQPQGLSNAFSSYLFPRELSLMPNQSFIPSYTQNVVPTLNNNAMQQIQEEEQTR
jgi:hypothetical protein